MNRRAPAALLALAVAGCVADADHGRDQQAVIGGTPTAPGDYPAVGALLFGGAAGCTGTLIQPDVVLTAAHCVDPRVVGPEVPGFTLDHDTVDGAPLAFAGAWVAVHDSFDVTRAVGPGVGEFFDVGLLVLAAPIPEAQPMVMASPDEAGALIAGLDVVMVGYGRTSNTGPETGVMHDGVADLITLNESELQVSAGGGAPQNCRGDSGGPGLADLGAGPRLIGIVSRSAALENDCDDGGIDTRVDHYRQWVLDRIAAGCGAACATPDAGVPDPDAMSTDPDAGDPGVVDSADAGCCATGGGARGGALIALLVLVILRRSRR